MTGPQAPAGPVAGVAREEGPGAEVLIVGAGPTGLTAAAELLRRGVRVRLIDAAAGPSVHSKAMLVWPRTLDVLEDLGLAGGVDRVSVKLRQMTYYSEKRPVTRMRMTEELAPHCLPQRLTEELLTAGLLRLGGHIERGVRLVALQGVDFSGAIHPDRPVTAVLEHADGHVERCEVPWVIGADGATSAVRRQLGIAYEGATYENRFLITDAKIAGDPLAPDEIHYYQSRQGVLAIVPQPFGLYRFFTNAPADLDEGVLADMQRLVDLRGPGGLRLVDPDWVTTFRVHRRRAASFQLGRVFLAGDAAHAHSPMGGQGLNTGIQDAQNLAWKLASVVRGHAHARLLDSYTPERAAVADAVVRDTDLQTRAAMWTKGSQVTLRDAAMRALDRTRVLNRFYVPVAAGRRWVYEPLPGVVPARRARPGDWCSARASLRRHAREGAALPRETAVALGVGGPGADPARLHLLVSPGEKEPDRGLAEAIGRLVTPWRGRLRVVRVGSGPGAAGAARSLRCGRAGFHLVRPDGHVVLHGHREELRDLYEVLDRLLVAHAPGEAVDADPAGGHPLDAPPALSAHDHDKDDDMFTSPATAPFAHTVGSGPHKVIVLHSLFAGHQSFAPLWPHLDGSRFTYAFMDARGFGNSVDVSGTYSTDEIASDVLVLADRLGWSEFSLIGHSLGGQSVQQVVLKAPGRVRRIIGLNPVPAGGMPIPDSDFPLFADAAHQVENRRTIIAMTTGNKLSDHWVAQLAETSMKEVEPVAFRAYLDSFRTTDFAERIRGAQVPALVVVGENDPAVTEESMRATWMTHYPNGELAVIGNAGHYAMIETPPALATLVEEFLSR
ncbi:alpha/beta fold hydrolase (plasmid) [Streptomyces sp. BI20]|uniref:alpha/beta fold hydrolase n=1 Tax=Streptomyces sp. BI20 TaxID=3403460 RepID=UPI003C76522B